MATPTLKSIPKVPKGYTPEMADVWKNTCGRLLEATGCMYKADIPYIDVYCRSYQRWQEMQEHASKAGLYDERLKLNELFKFEADLASKVRQNYRALEATILDRVKAGQVGESRDGLKPGTRQRPSREGVPQTAAAKKASSGGISWMDDIRKAG